MWIDLNKLNSLVIIALVYESSRISEEFTIEIHNVTCCWILRSRYDIVQKEHFNLQVGELANVSTTRNRILCGIFQCFKIRLVH